MGQTALKGRDLSQFLLISTPSTSFQVNFMSPRQLQEPPSVIPVPILAPMQFLDYIISFPFFKDYLFKERVRVGGGVEERGKQSLR